MKKLTWLILIFSSLLTLGIQAQEISNDLHTKISSGQYSKHSYLKAMLEKTYVEEDFRKYFTEAATNENVLSIGLLMQF